MRSKELSDKIRKRIEESKKKYDRKSQRAALLLRNETFLKESYRQPKWIKFCERWGIHSNWDGDIKTLQQFSQKTETLLQEKKFLTELKYASNNIFYWEGSEAWENFCRRWHVSTLWDGQDSTLEKFIDDSIIVLFRDDKTRESRMLNLPHSIRPLGDPFGEIWSLRVDKERTYIYLKIEPWTGKKDIEKIWSQIEELKKRIFDYSERDKKLFGRDLCWYDLNKNEEFEKQSFGKISILWRKYLNGDTISRDTIKDAVRRIQKYIDRLTPPSV